MMANSPDPDRGVTAYDYWVSVGMQLATWGNSYSIIDRNGFTSEANRILLTIPGDWQIKEDTNGVITYKHTSLGIFNVDDIIHFKINSWEGVVGLSPISTNRETMGLAIKQHNYAGKVYGSKPPGYLTAEGTLSPESKKNLKESWTDMTEGDNLGGTPVLSGGLKYQAIMIPPDDAQYIESRKMTKEEIYGIFRIPPTFAQDYEHTPYNTSEQQDLTFMKYTITPYLRNIEQELEIKLLPVANRTSAKPLQIRFNIESLLRADFQTRTEGYRVLINNGVLSANDVRQLENMNPIEGGDRYYMPMNMVPIDKIDDLFKDEESRAAYHELIKQLNHGKEGLHIRS
jgi:HK97 family phage portal protein